MKDQLSGSVNLKMAIMRWLWRSPLGSTTVLVLNLCLLVLHFTLYKRGNFGDTKSSQNRVAEDGEADRSYHLDTVSSRDVWADDWDGMHESVMNVPDVHWTNRRIILVRHGQYHKEGMEQGHLSSMGFKQAHKTAQRIRDFNFTIHKFYASTSVRAVETAKILHEYFPKVDIEYSDLLKEGKPTFPLPPIEGWSPDEQVFEVDGARIEEGFRTFIHRPPSTQEHTTNELFVVHGNVISYFTLRALQVTPQRWVQLSIFQSTITMMEVGTNGQVFVRMVGDVGHLPRSMWTG